MRILVTGITGAVGSRLAPRLLAAGYEVRALTRNTDAARRAQAPTGVRLMTGDAVSGIGLSKALRGVDVAYYLIHSMEPRAEERFDLRERRAAENFAAAAVKARVGRIVYLGGLVPEPDAVLGAGTSAHLTSRLLVERTLLEAVPNSVALRASIVIGDRSRSFRFLVRLVERMPILLIPAWRDHRTAPIDERDVLTCLTRAATDHEVGGRSLDLAGPDVVSYAELIARIRDQLMLDRPVLNIPRLALTPIASRVSALIAGEEHALIGPLMDGLRTDLLPRNELATELLAVRRHTLDAAIEHALREWELIEPLRAR